MVKDTALFLIDSTSLFRKTHEAFIGAPLILDSGRDKTFVYGFLKTLLALRRDLHINAGIVLISRECCAEGCEEKVKDAAELTEEIGIPIIFENNSSIIDICQEYAPNAGAIYSENEALVQFARQDLCILRGNESKGYEKLHWDTVRRKYGVAPNRIATFLALTTGRKDSVITRNQAVRLI